jgi:hypothetical protein
MEMRRHLGNKENTFRKDWKCCLVPNVYISPKSLLKYAHQTGCVGRWGLWTSWKDWWPYKRELKETSHSFCYAKRHKKTSFSELGDNSHQNLTMIAPWSQNFSFLHSTIVGNKSLIIYNLARLLYFFNDNPNRLR